MKLVYTVLVLAALVYAERRLIEPRLTGARLSALVQAALVYKVLVYQEWIQRNVHAESVDSLFCLFCLLDVNIFVVSKRRRTVNPEEQGRIVVSVDVVIFRGISFSLALSWCGVSTVLNPVPLANLNRLQPIATDKLETIFGVSMVLVSW